jgi:hypothetical protein
MNTINLSYFKQCAPAVKTTIIFQRNLLLVKCKRPHNKSNGINCHTATLGIWYRQSVSPRQAAHNSTLPCSRILSLYCTNNKCLNCPVFFFINCICTALQTPPSSSPTLHFAPMLYSHHHSPSTFEVSKKSKFCSSVYAHFNIHPQTEAQ